jgi:hypothetical protein
VSAKVGGIYKKGCWCGDRLRAKAGGGENLTHTRWSGGRGHLRRGKCELKIVISPGQIGQTYKTSHRI